MYLLKTLNKKKKEEEEKKTFLIFEHIVDCPFWYLGVFIFCTKTQRFT